MQTIIQLAACLALLAQGCLATPAPIALRRTARDVTLDPFFTFRVVAGGDASPFQFPWQAGLLTVDGRFFCGGSIIAPNWVLTAGHCVDPLFQFRVVVGALRMPKGHEASRKTFTTTLRHLHPAYDMTFLDNDIALLQLPASIEYNVFVKAVALPSYAAATEDLTGSEALISGWGRTTDVDATNALSPVLRYTSLKVVANAECEQVYGNAMLANKLCLSAEGGRSVCQGDSGGALVVRRGDAVVQVGITSFVSQEGCTVGMPQGFTRVSSFLDFIAETAGLDLAD